MAGRHRGPRGVLARQSLARPCAAPVGPLHAARVVGGRVICRGFVALRGARLGAAPGKELKTIVALDG
eukprot:7037639-Lingulodinium_polyedra.AAC.1